MSASESIPTEASPLAGFLHALFAGEDPLVGPFLAVENDLPADAAELLREWETRVREELSGAAPGHDPAASGWAACRFYHACQFLVDRDAGEETVRKTLATPFSGARGLGADYSVDLVFRFLPDLLRLAEQRAPGDALTEILRGWAREWPLSSVGIAFEAAVPAGAFLADASLRRLYLDRIFARGAKDRLNDPALRRQIEADAGPHPEFSAALAAALPLSPPASISPSSSS